MQGVRYLIEILSATMFFCGNRSTYLNNFILYLQDLAANGTNVEVTEAAKSHLDSYRYERHFIF